MSKTDQRDLLAMKRLRPKATKVKTLCSEGNDPKEMSKALGDMVKHLPAGLLLKMMASHRAMILANSAIKEIEHSKNHKIKEAANV